MSFSHSSNELVKRVEAALAGTEPTLTPPRSSPESPDRASSPESESGALLVRDMMSLPIRKRKLYSLRDEDEAAAAAEEEERKNRMSGNAMDLRGSEQRQSSVIQFAKAS